MVCLQLHAFYEIIQKWIYRSCVVKLPIQKSCYQYYYNYDIHKKKNISTY